MQNSEAPCPDQKAELQAEQSHASVWLEVVRGELPWVQKIVGDFKGMQCCPSWHAYLKQHGADAEKAAQLRIQRIIAERFLPILDDVFVAHKTHILRTTAISGGVTCIAGILGSKSVELKASGNLSIQACCKHTEEPGVWWSTLSPM